MRILLVDDHQIMLEGLRLLISRLDGWEVVGEAEDGRRGLRMVREVSPDIVLMDVGMPHLNGIEATRQILDESPSVKVLALSMHADTRFVTSMLEAGASGYVLKDCAFRELEQALRAVMDGHTYLSAPLSDRLVRRYLDVVSPAMGEIAGPLTAREREVLQLLAEGFTTKEIASELFISSKTVETHRRHIMQKLQIDSIAELTKYAIREGLTSL